MCSISQRIYHLWLQKLQLGILEVTQSEICEAPEGEGAKILIAEFKTQDGQTWLIDTKAMKYYLLTSLRGANGNAGILAEGVLERMGQTPFLAFSGRGPDSEPGNGLCVVRLAAEIDGPVLVVAIQANVALKDFMLAPPIQNITYLVSSDLIEATAVGQ